MPLPNDGRMKHPDMGVKYSMDLGRKARRMQRIWIICPKQAEFTIFSNAFNNIWGIKQILIDLKGVTLQKNQ